MQFCELIAKTEVLKDKLQFEIDFLNKLVIPITELNKKASITDQVHNILGPFQ